jgi:hypothetical protein
MEMPDRAPPAAPKPELRAPPTVHQLSEAVYRFCDQMRLRKEFVLMLFNFAIESVDNAWAVVDFAVASVQAEQGRRKFYGEKDCKILGEFEAHLKKERDTDLGATKEAQKKGNLLLRGLKQGRPWRFGPEAKAVILAWILPTFQATKNSQLDKQLPGLLMDNLRLAVWLAENAFTGENLAQFTTEFNVAKAKDEEARRAQNTQDAASAAPEAAVSEEGAEEEELATGTEG